MTDLTHSTVAELKKLLTAKEVSAKEVAQAYLDKSKKQALSTRFLTCALRSH